MKKVIPFFFALLSLAACQKENQPKPEVTFKLSISGFYVSSKTFSTLKSSQVDFNNFKHKYPPGTLTFKRSGGPTYTFNTGSLPIDQFSITLPIGTYTLTGEGGTPNIHGSAIMSFTISSQDVTITDTTTLVDVTLTPTCALFLVADENALVDTAYFGSLDHPFFVDNIFRYAYFKQSSYSGIIVKKNGETLSIPTSTCQIGHIYEIIVTDTGTTQTLKLDPNFTIEDPISW